MLPWRVETCALWQPTSHSGREELQYLEGEALAIAWCLKKARLFLLGCKNLTLVTDHKALQGFRRQGTKGHSQPRILNLKEKTLMFTFRIKYLKGDTNCAADALSRYPILSGGPEGSTKTMKSWYAQPCTAATAAAAEDEVGHVVDLHQVMEEAARDEEYRLCGMRSQ
ncbi:Retrovirus-related Pol polyprotein from transposon 17.6 [Chionoecetes opilio]|uniref:Retrovirus-related Pol polyprotein from transposon 17.6 n=1 Tax=Chionoecetes opilio TaxID=41210 RepID=A0A8J5CFB0_CHIOP|nr:Retrovirus-related Pol polyprotein from transposon 17.6 [Chionoecetes opilio]